MTTTTSALAHATLQPTPEPRPTAPAHPMASTARFRYDIGIVGLGYVGLPTALAFHAAGRRVLGIDASPARLAATSRPDTSTCSRPTTTGCAPPWRPRAGSFELDRRRRRACSTARTVIVCVPTPVDEHLVPDLTVLRRACASVVEHAVPGQTLILTSTTYVGSTRDLLIARWPSAA